MSDNNKLIKVNNQVLKRTDNIISITNKITMESQIPTKEDFDWWYRLDEFWKKFFNYNIGKFKSEYKWKNHSSHTTYGLVGHIDANGISETPTKNELVKILNLREIEIGYLLIGYEPLKKLKKLNKLTLNGSQLDIDKLILLIREFKELTYLTLRSNKITNIEFVKEFKNLTYLNLSSNQISNIEAVKYLKKLKHLKIHQNKIKDIRPIKKLVNLTELIAWNNNISNVEPLTELVELEKLQIDQNPIEMEKINKLNQFIPNCEIDKIIYANRSNI